MHSGFQLDIQICDSELKLWELCVSATLRVVLIVGSKWLKLESGSLSFATYTHAGQSFSCVRLKPKVPRAKPITFSRLWQLKQGVVWSSYEIESMIFFFFLETKPETGVCSAKALGGFCSGETKYLNHTPACTSTRSSSMRLFFFTRGCLIRDIMLELHTGMMHQLMCRWAWKCARVRPQRQTCLLSQGSKVAQEEAKKKKKSVFSNIWFDVSSFLSFSFETSWSFCSYRWDDDTCHFNWLD